MTSETYLDLTFDRSAKSGKRPIRPKLLKLTDVTIPHRNRKKTKVKNKDRSLSSVRDRIYDDPAYTDDISHLANPIRRSSCSGKSSDAKQIATAIAATGSSSLGKRSKLTKEFLQYAKQGGVRVAGAIAISGSYERDTSSSSDEHLRPETSKSSSASRRGRSLERTQAEKTEKKREKRERSSKQKRNISLDNHQQLEEIVKKSHGKEARNAEKRSRSQALPKQYSDGPNDWREVSSSRLPPDQDEIFSVRSSSKDSTSTVGTKMQIGRRFLKGEIGIKSFNYYLLKEGLKSSKKFVEKQRNSLTGGLGSGNSKKLHSRSEENIYEEIFFKDAPVSDEENQNKAAQIAQQHHQHQHTLLQQQHPQSLITAGTPNSQASEDAIYADCELCMQQCNKENCEYCYEPQMDLPASQRGVGGRPYTANTNRISSVQQQQQQQQHPLPPRHLESTRSTSYINQVQSITNTATTNTASLHNENNNGNGNANLPAAHILEFQSYNPNNPGVYKIETTPVAITGEYNPILQFQQSSSSTTTTTPSEQQHPQEHTQQQQSSTQRQQQQQQQYYQFKPMSLQQTQAYLVQASIPVVTLPTHYQSAVTVAGGILPILPQARQRGLTGLANGQQHYILSYNGQNATTVAAASMQRINTKSSSSSDSLQQQQLHKFNTMSRLEANMLLSDAFHSGGQMHPLMYAASRPIGGSQILVDPYEPPQMYKSDSKASILSEYSLRSSDNSHRYANRFHRFTGRGEVSDSSLGDSLFSFGSAQKRYFGSSESCRFAFECRRCSLDGGEKCSYSDTHECRNCDCSSSYFSSDFDDMYGSMAGVGGAQRGSGIPRKTAAGTLPSSTQPNEYVKQQEQLDLKQNKYAQDFFKHVNDVKRSIYQSEIQRNSSLDTPKHNDKEAKGGQYGRVSKGKQGGSPSRAEISAVPTTCSTLPLTKERMRAQNAALSAAKIQQIETLKPTPAPRTSLHSPQQQLTSSSSKSMPPKPTQRSAHTLERREYPSLDRLVAAATGAISKATGNLNQNLNNNNNGNGNNNNSKQQLQVASKHNVVNASNLQTIATIAATGSHANNNNRQSPQQSPKKLRITDRPLGLPTTADEVNKAKATQAYVPETTKQTDDTAKRDRYLKVESGNGIGVGAVATAGGIGASLSGTGGKRHHRTTTTKSTAMSSRRKDIPAPPPPSPATYSDLQELKTNMDCVQDDTKAHDTNDKEEATRRIATETKQSSLAQSTLLNVDKAITIVTIKQTTETTATTVITQTTAKDTNNSSNTNVTTTKVNQRSEGKRSKIAVVATAEDVVPSTTAGIGQEQQLQQAQQKEMPAANNAVPTTNTKASNNCSSSNNNNNNKNNKPKSDKTTTTKKTEINNFAKITNVDVSVDADDDDVFYDARSEDSAGTGTSLASNNALKQIIKQQIQQQQYYEKQQQSHKDVQNLAEGHKTSQQQLQHQPQQQINKFELENEKLHTTMDQDNKSKDTHVHENKNLKPKKDKNETSNNVDGLVGDAGKKYVEKFADVDMQSQSKVALNLVEGEKATSLTATTAVTPTKTTTIIITPAKTSVDKIENNKMCSPRKDSKDQHNLPKIKKQHERRSKHGSRHNQQKAANATLSLSCDTCCQIEQQQAQQQQQQQQPQQPQHLETRAKTKTTNKHERASKIKHETKIKELQTRKSPTPTTCADMLPSTNSDTFYKCDTQKQEIGAQTEDVCKQQTHNLQENMLQKVNETIQNSNGNSTSNTTTVIQSNQNHKALLAVTAHHENNVAETCLTSSSALNLTEKITITAAETITVETVTISTTPTTTDTTTTHLLTTANVMNPVTETVTITVTGTTTAITTATPAKELTATMTTDSTTAAVTATTEMALTPTTATVALTNTTTITTPTTTTATPITAITTAAIATAAITAITATTNEVEEVKAVAASAANSNVSCNSDIAGVATLTNSTTSTLPTITTTQILHTQSQESQTKRPLLQRQDYSCLDSSEAQSDDSHLTRDSITRESQNDELSSSTHDKIDVSTLPLPALPPKKRRSRLRASPSKYHSRRHEFDAQSDQQTNLAVNVSTNESTPHLSAFQQYVAKRRESLEASTRSFNEKLEARRMHYHMGGGGGGGTAGPNAGSASGMHMPTYLFGEHYYGGLSTGSRKTVAPTSKEEIFLNKSGWVQVNTKRGNDENRGYRRANYAHQNGDMQRNTIRVIQIDNTRRSDMARQALLQHQHSLADPSVYMGSKYMGSKVEELIQRNEARLSNASRDPALRPGYRIVDPQLANLLNERPGFLPVRNLHDAESPPPITPILSPPPAFQDSSKTKHFDRRKTVSTRQPQLKPQQQQSLPNTSLHVGMNNGGKGMVFSRSFEYDARRPAPADTYVETFSRSFDGNLSERPLQQRDRSPNFSTLTGNSPNYLTKKDSGGGSSGSLRSRDSSPKYQQPQTTAYLNASIKEAPPAYSVASTSVKYSPRTRHERSFERSKSQNILGRSRKSQFNRVGSSGAVIVGNQGPPPSMGMSRFRSFDTTISQRLNSCDSGARSDLSNDELDNEENEGSSEFLTTNYYQATSPFKTQRQRSLTPDRNESHSSSSSLRKQRSLTPESRSLTPEDRRKKGSQVSLMGSRQNSSSRSNTLERKPPRLEDKTVNISRSSSSSSYSGREAHENVTHQTHLTSGLVGSTGSQHRRSLGRNAKQTEEHRIRRSRSLQLSERSPNRSHKMIVCVGQSLTAPNPAAVYQQANLRANINSSGGHSNFPPTIRTTVKSQPILVNNSNSSGSRLRSNEVDKSRSFDFDYCNYNTATPKSHPSTGNISNNQNVPMRLDFDKSRSFDDDYREPINSNNNLSAGSMRYLKADGTSGSNSTGRLRRSSPVGSGGSGSIERTTRSPQSSGSSCNNLNLPRQSTSPQNYGTRLCDHELTYDMLRKSLDRSPIMDFRRGDSGDYDLPQPVIRNRETITSGGNSELNFMSNDTRIYEHPTTTAQITQSRSLGHNQSPSESQYSLERLQSSRDSIPADTMNDYRPEYVYRQPQKQHRESRSNNRGSIHNQTTKTTTATVAGAIIPNETATTMKLKEQKSGTCSFWPHCGACNSLDKSMIPTIIENTNNKTKNIDNKIICNNNNSNNNTTTTNIKRQNSLQTKCPHTCSTANKTTVHNGTSLRRNHSTHLNDLKDYKQDGGTNVSTVSVNVNVIKLDNSALIAASTSDNNSSTCQQQRKKTQWTLLCSGASATNMDTITTVSKQNNNGNGKRLATKDGENNTLNCVERSAAITDTADRPRVTPLAATSLVLLGNCEMPITRDREGHFNYALNGEHNGRKHLKKDDGYFYSDNERDFLEQAKFNDDKLKNNTNASNVDTSSTLTPKTAKTTTNLEIFKIFKQGYSVSMPNITEICKGFPRTTTTNDGISAIAIRNGFATNLSHQIRAVSSPCLTDAALEQPINYAPKSSNHLTVPTASYSATTSTSSSACDDLALQINGTGNGAIQRMPTSQSVGVLQKFKRTLTNFNKSQPQQQLPQQARPTKISTTTTATTTTSTQIPEAALPSGPPTLTTELPSSDIVDGAAGKYRFGPLIWRSSKERRKTKYNRRDKCNSGDSGIQIELENDEQFARAIAAAGGGCARNIKINGIEDSPKLRALRRANSAKATSMTDQTSAALNAKAKILKKMEIYNEREAPESLPTRSISQPNGLETFGISRADLDESDSDSVASHDDGPHNYPIYAEVLYSFTATGPQELGLERGTLIEVLRKEVGPWWFGRFKKDDGRLVDEILDIELGWFPKEFVRVIQYPDTDAFFMQHLAQVQQSAILPTSAAELTTTIPMPTSVPAINSHSAEIIADSANNVDMSNITTIVIESPPYTATANVNGGDCNALAPSRSLNVIMDGGDVLRRSAVKELLDTEANYVKLLASICEGYLPAMSKRIDIFSPNSIRLIFSNITAIYKFQRRFLEALRKGIEQNQVAKVFLKMHKGFLCYSTYCNAYPRALIELETYDRVKDARIILDNCRESENLAELPLSAHLLAPVQRICRYPLHLAEILKTATKLTAEACTYDLGKLEQLDASQLDIPDTKETIDMALEAMKSITEAVNEGKRHSETIARHQASFQNFKGPPLHLHSTRFFLQIDATRQKQNLWNSSCTLFLFDNQLVYCKRDLIKRSQFIYKGRIFLDRCRVVNVRDGKMFGHTIKNSLRIYCESHDKWYDFSFRSANRKHRLLNTLALERQFGGKALYVSEMTGFEYNYEERDYSDQSDYEMPDSESGLPSIRVREYIYDVNTIGTTSATSGESSVPESPAKSAPKFSSDTLPKKSTQQRDSNASNEYQTGSLGRRRLGNWFRKPKSSNSTPNHSPTHKPAVTLSQSAELHSATTDTSELNLVLAIEHNTDVSSGSTV